MKMIKLSSACYLAAQAIFNPAYAEPELVSHRAAYDLSLKIDGNQSDFSTVRGLLLLELRETCEGWVTNQELAFLADMKSGGEFFYDVRFSSLESHAADKLRFSVRSFSNGRVFEEYRGEAEVGAGKGVAHYNIPADLSIDLPANTVLPAEHLRQLIVSAQKGEVVVDHHRFDGSGPEGLTLVTAVIGQGRVNIGNQNGDPSTWPVSLAYYDIGTTDNLPEFEVAFNLHDNGIVSDLVLDYGDFTLLGDVREVEIFDNSQSCS